MIPKSERLPRHQIHIISTQTQSNPIIRSVARDGAEDFLRPYSSLDMQMVY